MAKKRQHTALTWIVREAKRLKKEYPRRFAKWNQYVAQASAIYSSKHHGKNPVGRKHPAKKTPMPPRKKTRKQIGRTGAGISTNSRSHTDYNRNKVNITVGAIRKDQNKVLKKVEHLLGLEEVKKFKAKGVRMKRKIQKRITALRARARRLMQ
jgi:hypothetical protein